MTSTSPLREPTEPAARPAPPWLGLIIRAARWTSHHEGLYLVSSGLRKIALGVLQDRSVDFEFHGLSARFRPRGNTADKRALLNPARFDPEELAFLEVMLDDGSVFVDIGANVGLYSLVAAKALGPEGRVLAFEPNPPVLERLRTNVAMNADNPRVAPIIIEDKAITDRSGPVTFEPPTNNLGEGRVLTAGESAPGSFAVEGIRLEDCLETHGITAIDVLKIDIEGHEIHALTPFLTQAARSLHPLYMIVERGPDDHWEPLERLFAQTGYEPWKSCRMNEIWRRKA